VLQSKVDVASMNMLVGLAVRETVGRGGGVVTVTLTESEVVAVPLPHDMVYVVVVRGDTCVEPDTGTDPFHPFDAVQVDALDDVHESVDVDPRIIESGVAVISTVGFGGGGGVTVQKGGSVGCQRRRSNVFSNRSQRRFFASCARGERSSSWSRSDRSLRS